MGEIKKQNQIMEEVKKMSKMVADDVKKAEQAITDSNKEIFDRKNDYDKAFKEAQTMSEEVSEPGKSFIHDTDFIFGLHLSIQVEAELRKCHP